MKRDGGRAPSSRPSILFRRVAATSPGAARVPQRSPNQSSSVPLHASAQGRKLGCSSLTAVPKELLLDEAGLPAAAAAARRIPKRPAPPSLIFAPPERSPVTAAAAKVARAKPLRRSGWDEACSAVISFRGKKKKKVKREKERAPKQKRTKHKRQGVNSLAHFLAFSIFEAEVEVKK